jgi:hypothetical protein
MITIPQNFVRQYDRTRAQLEAALTASSGYWLVDDAAEQAIHALRHRIGVIQPQGRPNVPEFCRNYPVLVFDVYGSMGSVGMICLWRSGGWLASLGRNGFPFPLGLTRGYGCRAVFPTAELAVLATMVHGADGLRSDLKVGDGLSWSPGGLS